MDDEYIKAPSGATYHRGDLRLLAYDWHGGQSSALTRSHLAGHPSADSHQRRDSVSGSRMTRSRRTSSTLLQVSNPGQRDDAQQMARVAGHRLNANTGNNAMDECSSKGLESGTK